MNFGEAERGYLDTYINLNELSIVNYRPVLSSERALQNNKHADVWREFRGERKIGQKSQMGAWHQDRLADWLSVAN
jgi:hypothetical protein